MLTGAWVVTAAVYLGTAQGLALKFKAADVSQFFYSEMKKHEARKNNRTTYNTLQTTTANNNTNDSIKHKMISRTGQRSNQPAT